MDGPALSEVRACPYTRLIGLIFEVPLDAHPRVPANRRLPCGPTSASDRSPSLSTRCAARSDRSARKVPMGLPADATQSLGNQGSLR